MNRKELTEQLVAACQASGLGADEQARALADARSKVVRAARAADVVRGVEKKKFAGPLNRPGGKFMGKQKSQPKEKD